MRSLTALQNCALNSSEDADPARVRELGDLCAELALHIETIQRQIDEAKGREIRRRAGSS